VRQPRRAKEAVRDRGAPNRVHGAEAGEKMLWRVSAQNLHPSSKTWQVGPQLVKIYVSGPSPVQEGTPKVFPVSEYKTAGGSTDLDFWPRGHHRRLACERRR